MPQNSFFLRTRDLLISPQTTQRHFLFTLHPLSTVIFATATVLAFVLLRNSNQLPLLYTALSNAYSEIGPEVRCDLSRLLSRKITKRIHSSKPASLNRLTDPRSLKYVLAPPPMFSVWIIIAVSAPVLRLYAVGTYHPSAHERVR